MRRLVISAMVLAAAACGDDSKHNPDASTTHDAAADTSSMIDASVCSYTEQHDTSNDYLAGSGGDFEDSGLTFNGSVLTICGVLNNGHFDATHQSVDIDAYRLTVTADSDVLVSLNAPGVESFSNFSLQIYAVNPTGTSRVIDGSGMFIGDHAVFSAHLAAGTYEFDVEAYAGADTSMAVPYTLKIAPDSPTTRCPQVTATANYTEAHDGATNRGNDVITIDYSKPRASWYALSASTTDAPEPTGLTLAGGTNYRVSGSSANVTAVGSYLDSDTYTITTGANTDQLSIRLNWTGANADLDYYLFDGLLPVGVSAETGNGAFEFSTFAVEPNKAYRLWVGAYSSSTGLPAPYDFSICAETFTP